MGSNRPPKQHYIPPKLSIFPKRPQSWPTFVDVMQPQVPIPATFLGSGPDRGRSPVEWGDFPFVRPFVRSSVRPPLWASQPGLRPSQPGLRPSQPGLRASQPGLRASQPGLRPSQPGLRPSQPSLRASQPAKPQASGLAGWASDLAGWTRGGNG